MSWPWDILNAATDTLAAIIALPWTLADIAVQLLMCAVYPVIVFFCSIQAIVNAALAPPLQFVNVLLGIPNLVITVINLMLVGVFPSVWIGLIVGTVLIVFGLRLYAIVSDIEILGCKI
jgi:hypothetical protein